MAKRTSDFLSSGAEAIAAGQILGMTDDEVLAQLSKKAKDSGLSPAAAPSADLVTSLLEDASTEGKLVSGDLSAQDIIRTARRNLNAAARRGDRSRQRPTDDELTREIASVLADTINSERTFREDLSQGTARYERDPNARMPQTTRSLESAGMESGDEFVGRSGDDPVSADARVRYAGAGTEDPTIDPNLESAIARNTFIVGYDNNGRPVTKYFREDEALPAKVLEIPANQRKLEQDTYGTTNLRVAGTGDEATVYESARYDTKDDYNAYLVRNADKNVQTYSRNAQGELVEDPNGTIKVKRVLSDGDATSFQDVEAGAATQGIQRRPVLDDVGTAPVGRPTIPAKNANILREIALRSGSGTLPSGMPVVEGFSDPTRVNQRENMYYQRNPQGGAPIIIRKTRMGDGEVVGLEAERLTEGFDDSNLILSERSQRNDDAAQARAIGASQRSSSALQGPISLESELRRENFATEPDISRLFGKKEAAITANSGDGFRVAQDAPYEDGLDIDSSGRYVYYDNNDRTVVYGQESPDSVVLEQMDRVSPEALESKDRSRRVGMILGELRDTTKKKGQQRKPVLSNDEENAIIAERLGVDVSEVPFLKDELRSQLGMGQSPQSLIRDLQVPVMSSGDYPQVDVQRPMSRLEAAVDRVLPEGQSFGPIRSSNDAYRAIELYSQLDRSQRPNIGGQAVFDMTGTYRLPTIPEDSYTPTVEEVVTSRITRRDEIKRVAENITSSTGKKATFGDIAANTGISPEGVKLIAQQGVEADEALMEIKAVGVENARLPESIQTAVSTPIQGGALESIGMMKEFREATDRTELQRALKQMSLAEQQDVNAGRKELYRDTGRSRMAGGVGTGYVRESEKDNALFAKRGREVIALEPGTSDVATTITADGRRLEPQVGPDPTEVKAGVANPRQIVKPVPSVPVTRNLAGEAIPVQEAVDREKVKIAGWANYTDEQRQQRLSRLEAKQSNAVAFGAGAPQAAAQRSPIQRNEDPGPAPKINLQDAGKTVSQLAIEREAAGRFAIPGSNPMDRAIRKTLAKPESELPPVSRPAGREDPGTFIVPSTGEKRSFGGGMSAADYGLAEASPIARAQAPEVATAVSSSVAPPPRVEAPTPVAAPSGAAPATGNRPPELLGERQPQTYRGDGAGGSGGAFDNNLGGYHTRGGDIYQERQRRTEEKAQNSRRRTGRGGGRDLLGRIGKEVALGAAALGAGVGIGELIRGEREEREEQNR